MPLPSLSVVSLPVPPFIRYALLAAGLSFVNDLKGLSEQALAEGAVTCAAWRATLLYCLAWIVCQLARAYPANATAANQPLYLICSEWAI